MTRFALSMASTCIASILLAGCTPVSVRKVDPAGGGEVRGVRYALPSVFLQTPSAGAEGAEKASGPLEPVFLPNSDRTYAIDASAVAASYTLNVSVKDGLLTQVDWKGNSTAVATDLVSKAGDLAKSAIDAGKQHETDVQNAKKALAEAELALEQAQKKFDQVKADPAATPAQKDEAEFALRKAKIDWAAAQNALNRLLGEPAVDPAGTTAPQLPRRPGVEAAAAPPAPAPRFLYSVVELPDGYVKLVAIPLPPRSP